MDEYDPAMCVTAEELREEGMFIPENIPDCAWVPCWSVRRQVGNVSGDVETGILKTEIIVSFLESFKWFYVPLGAKNGSND